MGEAGQLYWRCRSRQHHGRRCHSPLCGRPEKLALCGSPEGAKACAFLSSLIESTKANELEPYAYLRFLFEQVPFAVNRKEYAALPSSRLKNEDLSVEAGSGV
ncbi:MAG: hypothetical protein CSA21_08120 [Deltaproteobacteria bacterium]|nr:MAG: hypothetical protein CSA21_08120 [Deltaproteobacteria bacterium]